MRLDLLPKDFDGKMEHACEEAAEFIKAYMKRRRFGDFPRDEKTGIVYNNVQDMYDELQQLRFAVEMAIGAIEKKYMCRDVAEATEPLNDEKTGLGCG